MEGCSKLVHARLESASSSPHLLHPGGALSDSGTSFFWRSHRGYRGEGRKLGGAKRFRLNLGVNLRIQGKLSESSRELDAALTLAKPQRCKPR